MTVTNLVCGLSFRDIPLCTSQNPSTGMRIWNQRIAEGHTERYVGAPPLFTTNTPEDSHTHRERDSDSEVLNDKTGYRSGTVSSFQLSPCPECSIVIFIYVPEDPRIPLVTSLNLIPTMSPCTYFERDRRWDGVGDMVAARSPAESRFKAWIGLVCLCLSVSKSLQIGGVSPFCSMPLYSKILERTICLVHLITSDWSGTSAELPHKGRCLV
ncbi:hypothetical protein TNCV_506291 [Trichonephila clavipes]|nr:hypothetical protein TNCV_506291 [Trichonephila clavipes]